MYRGLTVTVCIGSSCAGQWYLPAGRMEPGETIAEAAQREVLEETGLEFEPTTMLMVEAAGGAWYRFVITGTVTGQSSQARSVTDQSQARTSREQSQLSQEQSQVSRRAVTVVTGTVTGQS